MRRDGQFRGRSICVVDSLSVDEQRYLYRKARELKNRLRDGDNAESFRISDMDYSAYLIFLENSTRTRESFRNASAFHKIRVNLFDSASSSFAKNESITDTIKMLASYAPESAFIIRSKLEGVCTWLDSYIGPWAESQGFMRPVFLNAGDGKHEHPTQEFLDEFTFLERLSWNTDHIHLVLTGDLYHSRTVHSKADGLKIFKNVTVDLVAPEEVAMPPFYIDIMKRNGFEVRVFGSLDEYLANDRIAKLWYFTRLQLERMGESVLEKAPMLKKALTFRQDMLSRISEDTKFYHPLPRDRHAPTIPFFLDDTHLNGWDEQSANGYYTRIVEMAMLAGVLGHDFEGQAKVETVMEESFVTEAAITKRDKPEYKVGIKPVDSGLVIDHIASGRPISEIWDRVDKVRRVLGLNLRSSHGVYHSNQGPNVFKGIVSVPDLLSFGEKSLKKLGAVSPDCTLNLIKNHQVVKKYRLGMPPRIYNFDEISCKNENCISHPKHGENVSTSFERKTDVEGRARFVCSWCEKEHDYGEIWAL